VTRLDKYANALCTAVFFDQSRSDSRAHPVVDRGRVFAAQAERLKEPLPDRRDGNAELAHAVIDDGFRDGRMRGRLVLDDFQRTDARPLLAPGAQEQASIRGRPQQHGTRR
jgi:hypothetical protein